MYKTTGNDGDYNSLRIEGDDGSYRYAVVTGSSTAKSYKVRVFLYNYFQFRYGFEPSFLFGTNNYGQDIITRLASGARFSFLLAISVSAINLFIGAIYGAIEGYYGGAIDLIMERISDILSGVPFIVVTSLFQLHLSRKVGVVPALLFAFVLTGWIGMASRVRMQFYRFKNQEYILAARTLGASDARLIFRHILPNSLGTIITSTVLIIPGVIFSESMLTYLGIVNLETTGITSIGTLLAGGRAYLSSMPHILMFPAVFIALLMISFNLFGNGLRDAFNPSLRGADE
jgi:oligopeptide transport system permease protein